MTTTTAVKERPILFSAPMIQALNAGQKTMTRRVVKPRPTLDHIVCMPLSTELVGIGDPNKGWQVCPHGKPGDRLWCRETWSLVRPWHDFESGHVEDIEEWTGPVPKSLPKGWRVWYAADGDDLSSHPDDRMVKRWRPSIFMPRWASRITLEITEVRVERLGEIGPRDAYAEGVRCSCMSPVPQCKGNIDAFRGLWDSINGPGSWDSDPFVWVIAFKPVKIPTPMPTPSFAELIGDAS